MKKLTFFLFLILGLVLVIGCEGKEADITKVEEVEIKSTEVPESTGEKKEVQENQEVSQGIEKKESQEEAGQEVKEDADKLVGAYMANQVLQGSTSGSDVVDPRKIKPHLVSDIHVETLVNKFNALPEDYAPTDLVEINSNGDREMLRKEAAEAWNRLEEKASSQGVHLIVFSSYRTKEDQTYLFENYLKRDPVWAMKYSAHPRRSEHEMGLAVDVSDVQDFPENFEETAQGKFMAQHAAEFGFILRYPKEKEGITGYAYEAWHYRYVGEKLARELLERSITLEEYYGLQGGSVVPSSTSPGEKQQGQLRVTSDYVNVRKAPDLQAEILGKLVEDEEVSYFEGRDGWYRILFQGSPAWIHGDHATPLGGE